MAVQAVARLGLGEPVAVSAETGEGMVDLYEKLQPLLDAMPPQSAAEQADQPLKLAIVGVPNSVRRCVRWLEGSPCIV